MSTSIAKSPISQTLPSRNRIKDREEFLSARKCGTTFYCRLLMIVVAPGSANQARIGITVSKKVHRRAVRRNYIKRCIRESFRAIKTDILDPRDIVVIARRDAATANFHELKHEFQRALQRAKLLQ